jgi:hypothetical protein
MPRRLRGLYVSCDLGVTADEHSSAALCELLHTWERRDNLGELDTSATAGGSQDGDQSLHQLSPG